VGFPLRLKATYVPIAIVEDARDPDPVDEWAELRCEAASVPYSGGLSGSTPSVPLRQY